MVPTLCRRKRIIDCSELEIICHPFIFLHLASMLYTVAKCHDQLLHSKYAAKKAIKSYCRTIPR